MMEQGLIARRQSKEDKRVYYLTADPKQAAFAEYDSAMKNAEEYIERKYSKEEKNIFFSMLDDAINQYIKELKDNEPTDD